MVMVMVVGGSQHGLYKQARRGRKEDRQAALSTHTHTHTHGVEQERPQRSW
jgi:hypothetical protein